VAFSALSTFFRGCNTLQHTATHCNTLQHTATHCNTLQHTATHCNALQHTAAHCSGEIVCFHNIISSLPHTATHCNTLQHTATVTLWASPTFLQRWHLKRCRRCWIASTPPLMHYQQSTTFSKSRPSATHVSNVLQCVAACCSVLQSLHLLSCVIHRAQHFKVETIGDASNHSVAACWACCSLLQRVERVAACCSVLQCVAVCCSVLQRVAVCCSVLQCVAACCSVLQSLYLLWCVIDRAQSCQGREYWRRM